MQLPILIECVGGVIVNALHVAYIQPSGARDCLLTLAIPATVSVNGSWQPGGSGSMNSTSSSNLIYGGCTPQEFMAKVNNALALINMMEKTLVSET